MSVLHQDNARDALADLSDFRVRFYGCLSARADAFFELADAPLCADGPTRTPVELSLLAEHQHDYGSLYGALNHGRLDTNALRDLLVSLPLPQFDARIVLTVDVSPWLRSDAACSPERLFSLVHGRNGRSSDHVVPGWPYSFIATLTPDRTSWTQVLDTVRLGPADDTAVVTARQLRADRDAPPIWLWSSAIDAGGGRRLRVVVLPAAFRPGAHVPPVQADPRLGQAPDAEPGGSGPVTWLIIAAHTQLRLALPLTVDQRKPWEKTSRPGTTLTPTRVRRGFRNIRPHLGSPARAPKPSRPGPGRPPGIPNRHRPTCHDVGKTVKRPETLIERDRNGPQRSQPSIQRVKTQC